MNPDDKESEGGGGRDDGDDANQHLLSQNSMLSISYTFSHLQQLLK